MKRAASGFTLVEMVITGTLGLLLASSGFMLYRSQAKMSLKQSDVNEAQLTVDYLMNTVRTMAVSAGGGLPQMANGIRKQATGKGMITYVNPKTLYQISSGFTTASLSTLVSQSLNTNITDGSIPVTDITMFDSVAFVYLSRNDKGALAKVSSIDVSGKKVVLGTPSIESGLGGVDFVYPVQYCSLYVDSAKYLRRTYVGKSSGYAQVPLALNIDSLNITYDVSSDGTGSFTNNVTDSSDVSRVKIFVRVKGGHKGSSQIGRNYETIVGIRRGRLFNNIL